MLRLLVLVVVVLVLAWLLRRALSGRTERGADRGIEGGSLVACANCGVLVPQREALAEGTRYYCSKAHALNGPRGP